MAKKKKPPFEGITKRYDTLIRGTDEIPYGIYQFYRVTADQLTRLHYSPKSIKYVKEMLSTLITEKYVQFDAMPTREYRSMYIYLLDNNGVEFIRTTLRWNMPDHFRPSTEKGKNYLSLRHDVGITDIVISAILLQKQTEHYSLARFIHEHAMKQSPYKGNWQGKSFTLIPDAFLELRQRIPDGTYQYMALLLEHDCATEQRQYFKQRIREYVIMLKSKAYKERFNVNAITILFTTFEGEKRRDQIREWAQQELASEPREVQQCFLFTTQQQPPDPVYMWLAPCSYAVMNNTQVPILGG